MLTTDFETRSSCDIKTGPHRYAEDPTTEQMCLAWSYDNTDDVYLWHPAFPYSGLEEAIIHYDGIDAVSHPVSDDWWLDCYTTLSDYIHMRDPVEAHNAMFERCNWRRLVELFDFPEIEDSQWRCSAAKAAARALPRALGSLAEALGLSVTKDDVGHKLMMKMCKPRAVLKADRVMVAEALGLPSWKDVPKFNNMFGLHDWLPHSATRQLVRDLHPWHESKEDLLRLFEYCAQDVRTEKAVSAAVPDLSKQELAVWQLDQEMNARGIYCDIDLAERALEIADEVTAEANDTINKMTDGAVQRVSQRQKLLDWVNAQQDTQMPNLQKATLDLALAMPERFDPAAFHALQLRSDVSKSSIRKFVKMGKSVCEDGFIRDLLMYHGASTGRWSGKGVQPQNFPRGNAYNRMKTFEDKPPSYWFDMDIGCQDIMEMDRESLDMAYGNCMEVLSSCLRGAMTAAPGHELIVADYSSIEARGVFWLAGDEKALNVFHEGRDIYLDQAAAIYGRPYSSFVKTDKERQVGKKAVLGLGYQMAAEKFQIMCALDGIQLDIEFCEQVVIAYRELHWPVKELWKAMEKHAIEAVRRGPKASPVVFNNMKFAHRGNYLLMQLPSKRTLAYCAPIIAEVYNEKYDFTKMGLKFWGVNSLSGKWCRQHTYGGKLTENAVQALSRDIMAAAMLRAEKSGLYLPILTVHDEIVAQVVAGEGSVKEFEELLCYPLSWAQGFPIAAEGWRGVRYRK